jgi:osmotically-inducible protein OsmY
MAFGNFWRGGRDRFGEQERDRNRDRWRTSGGEWRDEDRDRWRDERYGAWDRDREYGGREGRYGSSEWQSGEDYPDRSRNYGSEGYGSQDYGSQGQGGYGSQGYGGRQRYGSGAGYGGERYRGQGSEPGRGWGSEQQQSDYAGSRYAGSEYDYRGGSLYGGGFGRGSRSSYGAGSSGGGSEEMFGERYSQAQGNFRGRGPRGYRRSDERIREDVCDCLTDDAQLDASNLEVTVKDCEVTLAGSVNRREDKRRAEDLAESISGVKDVRNNLRVSQEQPGTERSGMLGQQQSQGQQAGQTGQTGQTPRH